MLSVHSAKAVVRRSRRAASAAGGASSAQPTDPVLCKDCVNFRSPAIARLEFGKCQRSYEIDLVTGEKTYGYASIAREHECDGGEHFQKRKSSWLETLLGVYAAKLSATTSTTNKMGAGDLSESL